MGKIKVVVLLVASLFSFTVAAETEIAVVDFVTAIFGSDAAQDMQKKFQMESSFVNLQAKLESTQADMKALQQDAEKKNLTWSKEDANEFQKKMEYLRADGELASRKLKAEIKDFQSSVVQELRPKAEEALKELLEEEGITLLLSREAVVVVSPELNVTPKLTDRINKKTK